MKKRNLIQGYQSWYFLSNISNLIFTDLVNEICSYTYDITGIHIPSSPVIPDDYNLVLQKSPFGQVKFCSTKNSFQYFLNDFINFP